MKVWKSPVFYFGILLVFAISGLLAAPYVVNWNSYRAELEAYGKALTGREVTINGAIAVKLFPWPQLKANDVTIANPPGLSSPDFAKLESVTVRMTLAGLASGGIDVQSIDVEAPVIHLERLATGEGNWFLQPMADRMAGELLSRVKLDQIRIHGGTVHFSDRRRGDTLTLDDVNASLASPTIQGPWRLRSMAVHNDRLFDISVNTAIYRAGEPFRFGVRVANADNSGLVWSFDGGWTGERADGELRIAPATTEEGKSDAEGRFRPLALTAKVTASFDDVTLSDLQVAPLDPKHGGAITTGTASVKLGRHVSAAFQLSSAILDLDELAGAKSRDLLREAGSLALADNLLSLLPANVSLAGGMEVTALKTGGETLNDVALSFDADRERLRISRFAAGLPGRSEVLFEGSYFPGAGGAELSGTLAVESLDLRALTFWLWPEGQQVLGEAWSGSRGRLKMQSDVSVTPARLRLLNTRYELDGEGGQAELSVTAVGRGAVELRADATRLDLDSYAPNGFSTLADTAAKGVGAVVALALPRADAPDVALKFGARELVLNGVAAADVAVDLESGANGLNLRNVAIGSVGGATLAASGLVLESGKGADGAINLDIKAEDPRELLKLAGLIAGDERPAWAEGLGTTALSANLTVKPSGAGPEASITLGGTVGEIVLKGDGTIRPDGEMTVSTEIGTATSGRLAALFGLAPALEDAIPAQLRVDAAGRFSDGFTATASVQAYDARLDYQGAVNPLADLMGLDGKLSVRSTAAKRLFEATGLPAVSLSDGVLVADTPIRASPAGIDMSKITGRLGQQTFSGTAALSVDRVLDAELAVSRLRLSDVLGAALLDWSGASPDQERPFAAALPFGITGKAEITPGELEIHPHFVARDAQVIVTAAEGEVELAAFAKDEGGRAAEIELASRGTDASRKLEGFIRVPVNLARQMALVGGAAVARGEGSVEVRFTSEGRSPGGALAGLRGSGSFEIEDFRLLGLSPQAFGQTLAEAKDSAGIAAAFDALRSGEGVAFGRVSGTVTIAAGEVGLLPFSVKTPDADIQVKTAAELALGEIDVAVTLSLKAREGLPAMTIAYAGPTMALTRSEDSSELARKLGVTIMQAGIDELERLQEEQKRLAAEEERQRIEDEARLAAHYAQRDELLLRRRELKVHAEMQALEAERLRRQIEVERVANAEINKTELRQRVREIRVFRRMARLSQSTQPRRAEPVKVEAPAPKPAPPRRTRQEAVEPVILANPEGAPVIISPPPSTSPTQ